MRKGYWGKYTGCYNTMVPSAPASINAMVRARIGHKQFPSYVGRSHAQARAILRARGQVRASQSAA